MKKTLLLFSCFILGLGATLSSQAHMDKASSPGKMACMTIADSCISAGYRFTIEGKNIWKNCLEPVVEGKTISGVTAKAEDIKHCKVHRALWKKTHPKDMSE